MNTKVDTPDATMTEAPTDPIETYISEATMPPKHLKSKQEMEVLRDAALKALEERYGAFTMEVVEQVEDPVHRYIVLGELASHAWGKTRWMDKLRAERRTAIQILKFNYQWRPMQIVRLIQATDRRVVDFAVDNADRTQLPKGWSEERAMEVAKWSHAEFVRSNADGEVARPVRDRMIHELTQGRWVQDDAGSWTLLPEEEARRRREAGEAVGRMFTNAALSRLGNLSSAAVAQIRTGTAPSARRAAAAA